MMQKEFLETCISESVLCRSLAVIYGTCNNSIFKHFSTMPDFTVNRIAVGIRM